MPGPLHGYRIVDLTSMISGPLATMILADQGADVIKVENPDDGDHTRAANNRRNGFSASFLNNNRNKRSLALDLKDPEAKKALLRLIATADVFVQNFRPGVADRMGLGEDVLRAVKPNIVYVSISGFGETGPFAGKPVYDPLVQAMSGLATIQAGSDTERPRLVRTIVPGDHRRPAVAGAYGPRSACPHFDAGGSDRVPVRIRHGQPDLRRR
jgi:crotonobetainyl-CoA:carnitine CoA-transferase CaiB-like acyl-CoA transferase